MGKQCWMGVDLSKASFDAALAYEGEAFTQGREVRHFTMAPADWEAFVSWAKQVDGLTGICVESTGRLSQRFLLGLVPTGLVGVSIVEPSRPKQFGKSLGLKTKTDRVDARVLAQFGLVTTPAPTALRAPVWRELKECSRLMETLQTDRAAYAQRLKDQPESARVREELQAQVEHFDLRVKALAAEVTRLLSAVPELAEDARRAQTIPGVGPKTAAVVLAELGDLRGYSRDEVVAYVGLNVIHHNSGTSVHRRGRLAKGGGGRLRHVLYMAAMVALQHNPHIRAFGQRLLNEGKEKMVVLGAAMAKLLRLIRAVVVTGRDYDPAYAPGV